jgi:hypothetical protein
VVVAVVAVVAAAVVDAVVAPAVPVALVAVHPADSAVSAEARHFRLHDKFEDFFGRARSSTRPILVFVHVVFVGLGDPPAANNSRTYQKKC